MIFLIGITFLFLDFTGTLAPYLGWMPKIQLLPAILSLNLAVVILLVIATLIFGRVYCSSICPLGVMQDIFAWVGKRNKPNRYTYSAPLNIMRYSFLGIMILAITLGAVSVVSLLAPYSAYGRIAQSLLQPVWIFLNNILADLAQSADSFAFYRVNLWMRGWTVLIVAALTLVALGFLSWKNGRTYCNTICPVGTLLGLLSRFSLLRPVIDTGKCNSCSLCARSCKASCIDSRSHEIDYSRCVTCFDCIKTCHKGAITYSIKRHRLKEESSEELRNASRRSFLTSSFALAAASMLHAGGKKVDGGLAIITDKKIPRRNTPVVPPGALGIRHLSRHCTACQLCIAGCPNGVLRPSDELESLMQPRSSFERGYCRPECTRCSEVCPTGAITKIDSAQKSSIQVGHAVWVATNCVPLSDGVECGNCARHCPVGAIQMVQSPNGPDAPRIPAVNSERCIGCGACENLCPARPFSAIYVEGHENHRTI